ncbi:MAG: hypothetical protein J0M17_21150, partial [Planctomycetes bacterium]|nr:hypothetical protein [Planctomycetota bacterium]
GKRVVVPRRHPFRGHSNLQIKSVKPAAHRPWRLRAGTSLSHSHGSTKSDTAHAGKRGESIAGDHGVAGA